MTNLKLPDVSLNFWASQVLLVVKNLPANADAGSIPGLESSPGGGDGNPLQYSCLENPMDRGPHGSPWGHKQSDTAEVTWHSQSQFPNQWDFGDILIETLFLCIPRPLN